MSERALEFVETWVEETIEKLGKSLKPDAAQGAALAAECLEDARKQGIPEAEIRDAYDDLAAYIASEIAEAYARKSRPDEGMNLVEGDDARVIDEEEDEAAGDK